MKRENKFREFRYFSSLQPRKFLPRKFLPLRYIQAKHLQNNYKLSSSYNLLSLSYQVHSDKI